MTTLELIENILIEIGLSGKDAQQIATRSRLLPRNRAGASVIYVPASASEMFTDVYVKQYENKALFLREFTAIKLLDGRDQYRTDSSLSPSPSFLVSKETSYFY